MRALLFYTSVVATSADAGQVMSFAGGSMLHGGEPITRGTRYILAVFAYLADPDAPTTASTTPSSSSKNDICDGKRAEIPGMASGGDGATSATTAVSLPRLGTAGVTAGLQSAFRGAAKRKFEPEKLQSEGESSVSAADTAAATVILAPQGEGKYDEEGVISAFPRDVCDQSTEKSGGFSFGFDL